MPEANPNLEPAEIAWQHGTPISIKFNDVYFSLAGGVAETQHVFIEKNHLLARWQQMQHTSDSVFTIIESGFGTGLNFLLTALHWQKNRPQNSQAWLEFISTEKYPLSTHDLKKCLDNFPELNPLSTQLLKQYPALTPGFHLLKFAKLKVKLLLLLGDINDTLPLLNAQADAWFLDGFSPAKNQSMWSNTLFENITRLSKEGCTFSTFSSAGVVKKGMQSAGFQVRKTDGFGHKRDMLCGVFTSATLDNGNDSNETTGGKLARKSSQPWFITPPTACLRNKTATVVGGGLAGTTTAFCLAQRGWQVTLIERHDTLANEASGNPAGVLYTKINQALHPQSLFYNSSYLYAVRFMQQIPRHTATSQVIWDDCGVLQLHNLGKDAQGQILPLDLEKNALWPDSVAQRVSADDIAALCGVNLNPGQDQEAVFFPQGGWVCPPLLCQTLVQLSDNITVLTGQEVQSIEREQAVQSDTTNALQAPGWLIKDKNQRAICRSSIVVLANSLAANHFEQTRFLALYAVRGQVTSLPLEDKTLALKTVLCHQGYALPLINNKLHIGATFDPRDKNPEASMADHLSNLEKLNQTAPDLYQKLGVDKLNSNSIQGRAAFRCQSPDYVPIVGPVPKADFFMTNYQGLRQGQKNIAYPQGDYHQGLFVNLAHGSRGLTTTPLAAEVIAAYANNETQVLPQTILDALNPARFLIRTLKKSAKLPKGISD